MTGHDDGCTVAEPCAECAPDLAELRIESRWTLESVTGWSYACRDGVPWCHVEVVGGRREDGPAEHYIVGGRRFDTLAAVFADCEAYYQRRLTQIVPPPSPIHTHESGDRRGRGVWMFGRRFGWIKFDRGTGEYVATSESGAVSRWERRCDALTHLTGYEADGNE